MNIPPQVKADFFSMALAAITGEAPERIDKGEYVILRLTPGQQVKARAALERQLTAAPGDVRIEGVNGIIYPVAARRLWPIAAALVAAGFIAGRL